MGSLAIPSPYFIVKSGKFHQADDAFFVKLSSSCSMVNIGQQYYFVLVIDPIVKVGLLSWADFKES